MLPQELKCDLAAEALLSSGRLYLQVTGGSMLPALWPRDLLTVCPVAVEELRRGDIVVYRRSALLCVHRLVRTAAGIVITRGDALPADDPPVSSDQILGRVVAFRRGRTERAPKARLNCTQKLLQIAIHRSSRFRALLLRWHALRLKLAA